MISPRVSDPPTLAASPLRCPAGAEFDPWDGPAGLMRLEARPSLSRTALVVAPFAAIAFTLGVTMLLVAWAGAPIGEPMR